MSGLCRGSALASRTWPRLPTATSAMSSDSARIAGSVRPPFWYGAGSACHWMSGAGSALSERLNPPDSAMFVVIGPECISCQRARFARPACSHSPRDFGVCHIAVTAGWSDRFAPTPGLSASTVMPCERRWSAGPIPDSMSSCGLPIAPAARMTSPSACAVWDSPRSR